MKKKTLAALALAVLAAAAIFLSVPAPVVRDSDGVRILQVAVIGADGQDEIFTHRIDAEQLTTLLGSASRSRLPHSFAPYQRKAGDLEIIAADRDRPLYILLGGTNVAYRSADRGGYTIREAARLAEEIRQLIS